MYVIVTSTTTATTTSTTATDCTSTTVAPVTANSTVILPIQTLTVFTSQPSLHLFQYTAMFASM